MQILYIIIFKLIANIPYFLDKKDSLCSAINIIIVK